MWQNLYRTNTDQSLHTLISPRASHGSIQQPPQQPASTYVATFEPLPRSSVARPTGPRVSVDENFQPGQHRHSSQYQGMQTPTATDLQPLSGLVSSYDPSMPPPPLPLRRSSMQEASNDIMRATYPPALPVPPDPPIPRDQSPRFFSPPRQRHNKGKGRALDIYVPAPPAGEIVGRCRWNPSFGYVCELCSRIVPNPSLHYANACGERCFDVNAGHLPYLRDVEADVARDPEKAIAVANAMRTSQQMQQGQAGIPSVHDSIQGFGGMATPQS